MKSPEAIRNELKSEFIYSSCAFQDGRQTAENVDVAALVILRRTVLKILEAKPEPVKKPEPMRQSRAYPLGMFYQPAKYQ